MSFQIHEITKQISNVNGDESPVCLKIARFVKYPKLSFDKVKIGKSKVLDLLIKNPNSYLATITVDQIAIEYGFQILPNEFYDEPEERFYVSLQPNESFSLQIKWTPKSSGNVRQVINFHWDGGQKLQAILLGNAEPENKRVQKKKIGHRQLHSKDNVKLQHQLDLSPARKVLVPIQPSTPARRTTFLVNKPPGSSSNEKENISDDLIQSLSPLSFEKQNKSDDISTRNHKNILPIVTDKRQVFGPKIKENAKRDLFKNANFDRQPICKKNENLDHPDNNKQITFHNVPKQVLNKKETSVRKGLAMKKLKLTKKSKNADLPRHPMPYAAKNMFYDERWIEKQERGFTNWLNFILTPMDETQNNDDSLKERRETYTIDARKQQPIAPSREDLSFRAYSLRRKMTRLRRTACMCYQDDDFRFIIHKIEKEVECGMLAVRAEKRIEADFGIKNHILNLLLSYNSLWLRIGLEVIFGELIMLHSNNDVANLSKFMKQRLLANPDIARKYSHPTVPNLFKTGYEDALSKFMLKKFLLLVLFLDHAKKKRLIDHNPCLFNKFSNIKASRDLLLIFSRDYLKGEGDITKHINYMGFAVTHTQNALDEFDFGVNNIAADLRDGVRLVRMVELLTNNWLISTKIRLPAVSRLQKVHNVGLALTALKSHGLNIEQALDAKTIVDGHREKTLLLLWRIIFHFQVGLLLDVEKLKFEVDYLKKIVRLKNDMFSSTLTESLQTKFLGISRRESFENEMFFKSDKLSLLLKWCKLICSYYNVKIDNFTVSFSDGIAFCCIVNFYHPDILPKSLISHETTVTRSVSNQDVDEDENDDFLYDNWTKCFSPNTGVNRKLETLLNNEKGNYRVLNEAVQELGGIPWLLKANDMSNTIPDEKVVITFVSYLCSRLLNIRDETQAARKIQLAWRQYILKKKKHSLQIQQDAAIIIQRAVRNFLAYVRWVRAESAAITIQVAWRHYVTSVMVRRDREHAYYSILNDSAVKIQSCYRGYVTRMEYYYVRGCVILCQAVVRGWIERRHVKLHQTSAVLIQRTYRSYITTARLRYIFLQYRASAVIIQQAFRKYKEKQAMEFHATLIQSAWKGYIRRKSYNKLKRSTIVLQSYYRKRKEIRMLSRHREAVHCIEEYFTAWKLGKDARLSYLRVVESTKQIQRFYRGFVLTATTRKSFLMQRAAATTIKKWYCTTKSKLRNSSAVCIQQHWRAYRKGVIVRNEYVALKHATIVIQSYIRGFIVRNNIKMQTNAVMAIQRFWRGTNKTRDLKQHFETLKTAARIIQSHYRSYVRRSKNDVRKDFLRKRNAVVVLQAVYRGYLERSYYARLREAVDRISALWLAKRLCQKERTSFVNLKTAATTAQRSFRTKKARDGYLKQKHSAVKIQSCFKGCMQRRRYATIIDSIIRIQALVRMSSCRKKYLACKQSTIVLQSYLRMFMDRERFSKQKRSALKIEAFYLICRNRKLLHSVRNKAAIKIQSVYKMKCAYERYRTFKTSATAIQSSYRKYVNRKNYLSFKRAVLLLQAQHRMHRAKKHFDFQKQQIVQLQSFSRMCIQRKSFIALKTSVLKLQALYRMRIYRVKYLSERNSAIKIQSVMLMWLQKRRYRAMLHAATVIQACWRMYRERKKYRRIINGVIKFQCLFRHTCAHRNTMVTKIQTRWRCYVALRNFKTKKLLATTLCALWRGYIVRKRIVLEKRAVITIQSHAKMFIYRTRYQQLKQAVCVVQRYLKVKFARQDFLKKRSAVIKIQSLLKGVSERRKYQRQRNAAVVIQSYFRMSKELHMYLSYKRKCILLQSFIRMFNQRMRYLDSLFLIKRLQASWKMYYVRKNYLKKKQAATTIQQYYRGYHLAQRKKHVTAVIKMQKVFRMHKAKMSFRRCKLAAIIIQRNFRAWSARKHEQHVSAVAIQSFYRMKLQRRIYLSLKHACVMIQSTWRMYAEKRCYTRKLHACIAIQRAIRLTINTRKAELKKNAVDIIESFWRAILARRRFKQKRNAAILIQSYVRMSLCRSAWWQKLQAVRTLQSFSRMVLQRNRFVKQRHAVVMFQSLVRRNKERKNFLEKKHAAVKLQSAVRCRVEIGKYLQIKSAAVLIQALIRGYIARRSYVHLKTAVVTLQALVRMHQSKKKYTKMRNGAVVIQSYVRTYNIRNRFTAKKVACIKIQRVYRSHLRVKKTELELVKSVTSVQSVYRMHKQRQAYLKEKRAASVIQLRYRAYQRGIKDYLNYHVIRGAIITIQTIVKGYLQRKHFRNTLNSAVLIQKNYRMHLTRRAYGTRKTAVLMIQACYRSYLKQKRRHQAALLVQGCFRVLVAKRYLTRLRLERGDEEVKRRAVVLMQSTYKMYSCRKNYRVLTNATIELQSIFRQFIARRHYLETKHACLVLQRRYKANTLMRETMDRYSKLRENVITMQAICRMHIERCRYVKIREAVLVIQRWYKRASRAKKCYEHFLKRRDACLTIQRVVREYLHVRKQAAVKISSTFKMYRDRKTYLLVCCSVNSIQSTWKSYRQRKLLKDLKTSALAIQKWYRNLKQTRRVRSEYLLILSSVLTIQRAYRSYQRNLKLARSLKNSAERNTAACIIQHHIVCYLARKRERENMVKRNMAAVVIQHSYRSYLLSQQNRKCANAAKKIQCCFRMYVWRKLDKEKRERRKKHVDNFIYSNRKCLAVLRIQWWFRKATKERRTKLERKLESNAATIQAAWRAYVVRRSIKDKRVKEARKKIDAANANVTEPMKLCNRTKSALDYLLHVKNLSTVHDALQHLDTVTLLSFKCCEQLCTDNALPVIYRIIHYGNRSLPWISIKQVAFSILLNVAKCPTTYRYVYNQEESMNIILEQMGNFRDKKAFIFPIACNLLTVLCNDEDIRKNILGKPKHLLKLTGFFRLTLRKQKLDLQRNHLSKIKEQHYSTTSWHRRASSINSRDPHTAITMLIRKLDLRI